MVRDYWSYIKDPIWGYIKITNDDRLLIDSFPVQRLRRLKQLSLADIVYPGAVHTRFEHSLGVMHVATEIAKNLPVEISKDDISLIRYAALLHDIGHGPFSHLFEHYLEKYLKKDHEDIGEWIILKSQLADIISKIGYDPKEIVGLALRGKSDKPVYMKQIIRSAVDADKLDFIRRDNYHTGASYGNIDVERLIYTMEVVDDKLAVNMTALSVLEMVIISRVKSFESIYYHKTIRGAQLMFIRALEMAIEENGLLKFDTPEDYLQLDDYTLWSIISKSTKGNQMLKRIESRDLIKMAYEKKYIIGDEFIVKILSNENIMRKTIEEISNIANVDPESIYIDAPSLPSVPYHGSFESDPTEIPIVKTDGEHRIYHVSEVSRVIDVLKGYLNILRVYTDKENREAVNQACLKLFGSPTVSGRISV